MFRNYLLSLLAKLKMVQSPLIEDFFITYKLFAYFNITYPIMLLEGVGAFFIVGKKRITKRCDSFLFTHMNSGNIATTPCPLEIHATAITVDIDYFTRKVQSLN